MGKLKNHVVFFDFDNTITTYDVLDDMFPRFSKNDKWEELERLWKEKKIGSRECLKGQIENIEIAEGSLNRYLKRVKLDPYFKKIISLLNSKNVKTYVLTDNFDLILRSILRAKGITPLNIYCNKLKISGSKLTPSFPLTNKRCKTRRCGHCKKSSLLANSREASTIIYVGDGLSDACPAKYADMIFAKDDLKAEMKKENIPHIPFTNLKKVYEKLRKELI